MGAATGAVAIGFQVGENQQEASIAIGRYAGNGQGVAAIAVGSYAGYNLQGQYAVAVGSDTGGSSQGDSAVAVGRGAGYNTQGQYAVAVGVYAGSDYQSDSAVAVGMAAGTSSQGDSAVAVGKDAGTNNQGISAVAIGSGAGLATQGENAVAIGSGAGSASQGENAIAIGNGAGAANQPANSIILNATGIPWSPELVGCYIRPLRAGNGGTMLTYASGTGEVTHTSLPLPTAAAFAGASVTTISTVYADLAAGPSISLNINGTNGALVTVSAGVSLPPSALAYMSYELTNGLDTVVADDQHALIVSTRSQGSATYAVYPPTTGYWTLTAKYKSSASSPVTFANRSISAVARS